MLSRATLRGRLGVRLAAGAAAAALLAASAGEARTRVGVSIGFPLAFGPPVYYAPPPYYYPPPPVVYVPPPVYAPPPVVYSPPPAGFAPTAAAPQQTCREYQSTVIIAGQPQQTYGTACLQADGTWRIVR